jgi:type IV pilus assembly protein PilM
MTQPPFLQKLAALFQDPPPEYVFEVGPTSIAMARTIGGTQPLIESLDPGVLSPSPVRDNVLDADAFAAAVKKLVASTGPGRRQRRAALILPDHSARVSVLDFDTFPTKPDEQLPLLQFRLKKSLPYDLDAAVISYFTQPMNKAGKHEVVAVAAPLEVIARYEAPFRVANVNVGIVTISHLAMLDLVQATGIIIIAKLSDGVLTVMAVDHGTVRLVRSLELTELTLDEIAADLYPTFAYAEDSFGARPETLLLCGFGQLAEEGARRFEDELSTKVDVLRYRNGGLAGYLHSRRIHGVAA